MRKIYLLLIVLFGFKGYAQVNLQTGASQISLPLFSYSDKDNLNCNISLDYIDGNGLKVNEVASSVGTGWNMQFGGVIIREQRGLPDDQERSRILQNPLPTNLNMSFEDYNNQYYPNGYLYSLYSPTDNISNEGAYVKMYHTAYEGQEIINNPASLDGKGNIPVKESIAADREQDIFHLNYINGKVDFVIGKNGQVKILNDARIRITINSKIPGYDNIKTNITQFVVTDEKGIQYIFAGKELTQLCTYRKRRYTHSDGFFSLEENDPNPVHPNLSDPNNIVVPIFVGNKTPSFIVTKWYLTQILNPRTGKRIVFNYDITDLDLFTERQLGEIIENNKTQASLTIIREVVKSLRIKSINLPTTTINFLYDPISRLDLPNGNPLKEIEIIENTSSSFLKKYKLSYGYFYKSEIKPYNYQFNASEKFFARLCLQSIQQISTNNLISKPPYLFDYYLGEGGGSSNIVPPTFSYWIDHCGFYNAQPNTTHQWFYQPNQMLTFPHFGQFCQNTYSMRTPVDKLAQNGIIKKITYPYGGTLSYEYEQNDAFYQGQNVIMGGVRTLKTTLYDGINHNNDITDEYKYVKEDNVSSSGWGYEAPQYSNSQNIRIYKQAGNSIGLLAADIGSSVSTIMTEGVNIFWGKLSTSVLEGSPNSTLISTIIQIFVVIFTPQEPEYKDLNEVIYSSVSNQSSNPLPFQYSRVEVINKTSAGNNGKTVYEFTSDSDKPIDILTFSFPFSNKDRYVPWAYGLPKRVAIYNNDNPAQVIKETVNAYRFISSFMTDANFISKKWAANRLLYDAFPSNRIPFDYVGEHNITESIYYPQTGHTELTGTSESVYDKDQFRYINKTTNYIYNPINYQVKTITTSTSKGELIEQRLYYPEDYTLSGFIQDMKNANMVNTPVSTETWITKLGVQPQMISSSITEFGFAPDGDIKPIQQDELFTEIPLQENQIGVFNPSMLVRNSNFIKSRNKVTYDANGSAVENIDLLGNRVNSTIYDYNNQYVIAKVTNAYEKDIAYTSFEADATGGWTINSGTIIADQGAITGRKMFSGNISKTFASSGNYIVSLWAKGTSVVTVNGTVGNLLNTVQGWKLYSWSLNSVTNVTVNGSSYDEVRLYPFGSRMSTATYDPLIGKTSECNENNQIIYYDYNELGQLVLIRDQNRNVLKKYCYNFSGRQENCEGTYVNDSYSKTYTATSCDANHHPEGPVTYTVEKGKYTSGISKEDANQKAQQDIENNGQLYANAHVVCISNQLYATVTVENQIGNQGDVVIRFYNDAARTVPMPVDNLTVSIQEEEYNDVTSSTNYNTYAIDCTGAVFIALPSVMLIEPVNDQYQSNTYRFYSLIPGDGYIPIY